MLEIQQRNQNPQRHARSARVRHPASHLNNATEQIDVFDPPAFADLARQLLGNRRLKRLPGHPHRQLRQWASQIDHLIEPTAEKILGIRRNAHPQNSQKLHGCGSKAGSYYS
jgi:hypothetical protein